MNYYILDLLVNSGEKEESAPHKFIFLNAR